MTIASLTREFESHSFSSGNTSRSTVGSTLGTVVKNYQVISIRYGWEISINYGSLKKAVGLYLI
jgi:hypothetical protein